MKRIPSKSQQNWQEQLGAPRVAPARLRLCRLQRTQCTRPPAGAFFAENPGEKSGENLVIVNIHGYWSKPCVFSRKVAPGVVVGNLVCATGPAFTRLRSNAFSLVKLNSGEHCDGCIHLVDCRGGGRSCSVICQAVMADRSGTGVHRWCLDVRNRTKPCVFSHKVAPGVYVGNLVCATGPAFARLRSNASSLVKLNSGVQIAV
jgi:hypothetical protein